jgi:hypothetical protein
MFFVGQQEKENLVFFARKHWLYLFQKMFFPFIYGFFVFSAIFGVSLFFEGGFFQFLINNLSLTLLLYMVMIYCVHWMFIRFHDYMFNLLVVSDTRLIEINQCVFFKELHDSVDLLMMQDLQSDKDGFFQQVFDFGNLNFTFTNIADMRVIRFLPKPLQCAEYINKLRRRLRYTHEQISEPNLAYAGVEKHKEVII